MTGDFEVIARLRIRPGHLEDVKSQAAEMIRLTREMDTRTVRYDWYINEEAMECEVHEAYVSEQGLIEHNQHIMEARAVLFRDYAYDHRMSFYAPISKELTALSRRHAGGGSVFSFVQGLELSPTV